MGEKLLLVEPASQYAAAFIEMAEEFHAAGEQRYDRFLPLMRGDFPAYVRQRQSWARGENLSPGYVPEREFWLLERYSGRILGAIRLRAKEMTPRLERIDGQIGYNIRPGARRMGYGTRMLAMLLEKMETEGWQRVLVTCNADNVASARVIENNGGRLENQVVEEETGKLISRYWIVLNPTEDLSASTTDISLLAANLEPDPDGIWVSKSRAQISYPEEGNLNCLSLEEDSFWFAHRNRCIQTLIQHCPPPGTVFDIGGGNGYVARGLEQAGILVALVEPGWAGVQNARARGVQTLICSTLEDAGFRDGALPAVGLFDVLEHVEDDLGFLKSIHTLLEPGGRLYLTVPAYSLLWSVDDEYAGHFRRYTLARLRQTLMAAGLRVEFATYIFFVLPAPIFLLRAIPSRLGLRKEEAWDRYQAEHKNQQGMAGRALEQLLSWELAWLRKGRAIPLGGSCLIAAQKMP